MKYMSQNNIHARKNCEIRSQKYGWDTSQTQIAGPRMWRSDSMILISLLPKKGTDFMILCCKHEISFKGSGTATRLNVLFALDI